MEKIHFSTLLGGLQRHQGIVQLHVTNSFYGKSLFKSTKKKDASWPLVAVSRCWKIAPVGQRVFHLTKHPKERKTRSSTSLSLAAVRALSSSTLKLGTTAVPRRLTFFVDMALFWYQIWRLYHAADMPASIQHPFFASLYFGLLSTQKKTSMWSRSLVTSLVTAIFEVLILVVFSVSSFAFGGGGGSSSRFHFFPALRGHRLRAGEICAQTSAWIYDLQLPISVSDRSHAAFLKRWAIFS